MKKVYVYEYDSGFDLFLSDRELTDEERYCPACDEYHTLKVVTSDINDMLALFPEYGFTPECAIYNELVEQFNELIGDNNDQIYNKQIE